jgi:hypothetical protein
MGESSVDSITALALNAVGLGLYQEGKGYE